MRERVGEMDASLGLQRDHWRGVEEVSQSLAEITPTIIEAIPAAVYVCSADGIIRLFNQRAVELWGRRPSVGDSDERFCGAAKLYDVNGLPLAHVDTPMEEAIRTGEARHNKEVVIERPDGSRIVALVNIKPLRNRGGQIVGAINSFQDITDLRRAQIDMRAQGEQLKFLKNAAERDRQLLASIVEFSDDAILSKDLNGVIMSWNRGAERLFGYTAKEMLGKFVTVLIPPDRVDEELMIFERIRRGERIQHFETVRRHKSGSLLDISLAVSPIKDECGCVIGASTIARDFTDQRRTEVQLNRRIIEQTALFQFTARLHRAGSLAEINEAALDTIISGLECQRAAILLIDQASSMRFVAWRGLSESYRGEVEGHSPWEHQTSHPVPICIPDIETSDIPPVLKSVIKQEGIRALSFIPLVARGRLIGKFMTYFDSGHIFNDEEIELGLTIARQLAFSVERQRSEEARDRAEEALRDSEHRLEFALSAGQMGAWEWDIETDKVIWSPGLELIHGLKVGEFGGRLKDFERDIHPDDRERVKAEIQRCIADGRDYGVTYRVKRPDGPVRWLEAFGRLTRNADGNPQKLAGVCMDITERKENELQRDLLVAELSHRVKNTLSTVISIEQQSFLNSSSIEGARRSFTDRIRALAHSHARLAEGNWSGVSLEAVLREELALYQQQDGRNVRLSGPPVTLKPKCALTLGLAVHELATNAAKYGALSSNVGNVEVRWTIEPQEQALTISWLESGGPPVSPPKRSGFGRLLLERAIASDLSGRVELDFAERGIRCVVQLPVSDNVVQAG